MVICERCGGENDGAATRCATCAAALAPSPPAPNLPPLPVAPAVTAELIEPVRRVAPGQDALYTLTVRNLGPTAERIAVEVMGDAAAWSIVEPSTLDLLPRSNATVAIRVRPPRGPDGRSGSVDLGIAVHAVEEAGSAVLEFGVLEIESPPGAEPARRRMPAALAAVVVVAVVAVAGMVVLAGSAALGPGSSPAAVVTSSPEATASPPTASPTFPTTPMPSPELTLEPPPTLDPGAPVAWWQDAVDAAAERGIVLGAVVAEGTTDDNLPYAEFGNGSVVQRVYDAYWMSDDIWRAWRALGGGPGPAQLLGYPTSTLLGPDLAARRQLFDDGAIYWTAATGAHAVHGPVWDWWRTLVGERGGDVERPGESGLVEPLGHPIGDVRTDANGAWIELEAGRIGVFDDGERWACAHADPASGFPPCAELRADPMWPAVSGAPAVTPAP